MRRIGILVTVLSLLALPARGAETKYVALTFDDGPSGRFTQRLLDGLDQREVKATFFLCGYRIRQYPELTRRIWEEGHEIGYHGYSHDSLADMSRVEIGDELIDTRALMPRGCEPVLLRTPEGRLSDGVRHVARARKLAIIGWSLDPRDWETRDAAAVTRRVCAKARDGDIILLHDMSDSSVDAALRIVDNLQKEGFTFVTVSRLAELRQQTLKPGLVYNSLPPEAVK